MNVRMAYIPKLASRSLIAAALAMALGVAGLARPAEAGSRWVGPFIAGAVVGGILAHEYQRHHYRSYPRYYDRRIKYRRSYHGPRYHAPYAYYAPYAPAVVIPVPVPLFVVPGRW